MASYYIISWCWYYNSHIGVYQVCVCVCLRGIPRSYGSWENDVFKYQRHPRAAAGLSGALTDPGGNHWGLHRVHWANKNVFGCIGWNFKINKSIIWKKKCQENIGKTMGIWGNVGWWKGIGIQWREYHRLSEDITKTYQDGDPRRAQNEDMW